MKRHLAWDSCSGHIMPLRLHLAILLYPVAVAMPAGVGTIAVLCIPGFSMHAGWLLPYVGAESLVIGAAIAWHVAPILLAHDGRRRPTLAGPPMHHRARTLGAIRRPL